MRYASIALAESMPVRASPKKLSSVQYQSCSPQLQVCPPDTAKSGPHFAWSGRFRTVAFQPLGRLPRERDASYPFPITANRA